MKTTETMVLFWRTADIYSNWHLAAFAERGRSFSSTEQYMMWAKAVRFGCYVLAAKMLAVHKVKKLKEMGRDVTGYNEEAWERERMPMMVRACWLKFTQNPAMRDELLATGERILVEASPDDKIWGILLGEDDPRALDEKQWLGRNLLGYALMDVRRLIRAGEEPPELEWLMAA
ncbi:NADAR family protein [Paraburkholderia aspalathi]|nr:NADAR family protein [Paraburkholderia aspalathi]MBK3779842.1 NADAR family protein [Paraburkholderia aspalathi]